MASFVVPSLSGVRTCYADAFVQLDRIDENSEEMENIQLREIIQMVVADARQVLAGKAGWEEEQVNCLSRQILSGEFGDAIFTLLR